MRAAASPAASDDDRVLSAGGTLTRPELTTARRLWLSVELILLFIGAPLAVHWAVHGEGVPVFAALLPVLAIAIFLLAIDPTFSFARELKRGISLVNLATILAVLLVVGGGLTLWVRDVHPDWFLEFPTNRPETYKKIMILYPLFSVVTQEVVYRTFYFHRFGPLFGHARSLGIVMNSVLFGFAHIVVDSPFAIASTAVGGLILATRYALTRSYWAVYLEHALWGWLVFTVGLGRFFFSGVSNL